MLSLIPSSTETLPALSRGVSLRPHSIKLYTFAYKFISKLHQLDVARPGISLHLRARAMDDTSNPPI
jgi:hypothetical protein